MSKLLEFFTLFFKALSKSSRNKPEIDSTSPPTIRESEPVIITPITSPHPITSTPQVTPSPASVTDSTANDPTPTIIPAITPPSIKDVAALVTALAFTLKWEGGYVNDPDDPGGATNKGITHKVYDEYRMRNGLPLQDVKNITDKEVYDIYYMNYWKMGKCDLMPPKLAIVHFDTCVNSGIKQAARFLQRSIGCADDGVIGPKTLDALRIAINNNGETSLVTKYIDLREAFLRNLAQQKPALAKFLKGWLNRVSSLEPYALDDTRYA